MSFSQMLGLVEVSLEAPDGEREADSRTFTSIIVSDNILQETLLHRFQSRGEGLHYHLTSRIYVIFV